MAQQELPEVVPGVHQISTTVLDAAHQIAEMLILNRRHEHKTQQLHPASVTAASVST